MVHKEKGCNKRHLESWGEDLANLAAPSFDTQLAGRAAGVQVTTPSGVLGSGPQFKVRGMSTISASSQPLFIIDGMPLAVGDNSSGSTGMGMLYAEYNAMSDINPNDIESIEILKDGAATAIYGSRAANGVILITTKKGSKGRTSVNYDGYITAASPAKLHDLLGAKDFVTIANEKYENWGMKDKPYTTRTARIPTGTTISSVRASSTITVCSPAAVPIRANITYRSVSRSRKVSYVPTT